MFIGITWGSFLFWLFIATVLYLVVIGYMYYRKDVISFFSRRKELDQLITVPVQHAVGDPLPIVHELVSELGVLIRAAAEGNTIHAELFFSLQNVVKNYLILGGTEFPQKINVYIREELLRFGIPALSDEEFQSLWKRDATATQTIPTI